MRVAEAVHSRIQQLDLPYDEVAKRANIGVSTLRNIRTGRHKAHISTLRDLSRALSWPPDHLQTVRDQKMPLVPGSGAGQAGAELSVVAQALERILAELKQDMNTGFQQVIAHVDRRIDEIERRLGGGR